MAKQQHEITILIGELTPYLFYWVMALRASSPLSNIVSSWKITDIFISVTEFFSWHISNFSWAHDIAEWRACPVCNDSIKQAWISPGRGYVKSRGFIDVCLQGGAEGGTKISKNDDVFYEWPQRVARKNYITWQTLSLYQKKWDSLWGRNSQWFKNRVCVLLDGYRSFRGNS